MNKTQKNITLPTRVVDGIQKLADADNRSFGNYVTLVLDKHLQYSVTKNIDETDYPNC